MLTRRPTVSRSPGLKNSCVASLILTHSQLSISEDAAAPTLGSCEPSRPSAVFGRQYRRAQRGLGDERLAKQLKDMHKPIDAKVRYEHYLRKTLITLRDSMTKLALRISLWLTYLE